MNLYWEIDERRFVAGLSDPRVLDMLDMPAADIVPLRIYIVERESIADPFSTQSISNDFDIVVAAKVTAGSANYLFFEDEFTDVEHGNYTYYSAELDLHTEEIAAAMGNKQTLTVIMEIALRRKSDDAQLYSTTIRLKLANNIINITDAPIVSTENIKFINNILHIRNQTTGEWHPVEVDGEAGQQHIKVGEGS